MSGPPSWKDKEGRMRFRIECQHVFNVIQQQIDYVIGRTIAHAQPDDFWRMAVQKTPLVEIFILGGNDIFMVPGESPDHVIVGAPQAVVSHMR
jgi:hypothetical protein